jgi:hypothetical protein
MCSVAALVGFVVGEYVALIATHLAAAAAAHKCARTQPTHTSPPSPPTHHRPPRT